jgi:ABC-type amino acid transport substrate-binding protein
MKQLWTKLILIVTLSFVNYYAQAGELPPDITAIQKSGVLKVAVYVENSVPITSANITQWQGVDADLAHMIAEQLGVTLMVIPAVSYDDVIYKVASHQADMGTELYVTPERALQVSFSHPYFSYHPHLLVNRLKAAKYGWNSSEDIIVGMQQGEQPLKIGILAGSAMTQLMPQSFPKVTLVPYTDINQAFQDVAKGKLFAAVATSPLGTQGFFQKNMQASLVAEDIELPEMNLLVSIALPWENFHFREWVDAYFDYLQRNGIFEQLLQKHGIPTS